MIFIRRQYDKIPKSCNKCWDKCMCSVWAYDDKYFKNKRHKECPIGSVTHEQITDIIKGWLRFNHTPEQLADQIMLEIEGK